MSGVEQAHVFASARPPARRKNAYLARLPRASAPAPPFDQVRRFWKASWCVWIRLPYSAAWPGPL